MKRKQWARIGENAMGLHKAVSKPLAAATTNCLAEPLNQHDHLGRDW